MQKTQNFADMYVRLEKVLYNISFIYILNPYLYKEVLQFSSISKFTSKVKKIKNKKCDFFQGWSDCEPKNQYN